ncbi:MAG: TIGR00366 family protein [Flavobacteriaceae bacterium]|nr:TIGR00366 family protein [Flavobacteriaceae bacterium]|tara:strand:- start:492 stop:1877 length:1386 start_codon:yes stop_codon:yes gene_type:complete
MHITKLIENFFKRFLPSPFIIAVLLTFTTIILAVIFSSFTDTDSSLSFLEILSSWERGIWNSDLLVFAYQMILILVLGNILVLSTPVNKVILLIAKNATSTEKAVVIVSFSVMLVAFFNWGLGLIFGAILARKIGDYSIENNIELNYPLVGAAGYVGLMVWHSGISGSAPIKVAEDNHLFSLMSSREDSYLYENLPTSLNFDLTVLSNANLITFSVLLVLVPLAFYFLSKNTSTDNATLKTLELNSDPLPLVKLRGLENSRSFSFIFAIVLLIAFFYQYSDQLTKFKITPNSLNFFMLGLSILLHSNFKSFLNALKLSINGASGILIQFPLYFGIMGIMKESGMIIFISDFFISISNEFTLPIFTFFSAAIINVFVPSGGGQWVIQGPVVIAAATELNVPIQKVVMALAYGDQLTNMLQPFWALPLLAITKLKAKEILPYTLIIMLVGLVVFILSLIVFKF